MKIIGANISKTKNEKSYIQVMYFDKDNNVRKINVFNGDLVSIMKLRNKENNDKLA